MNGCVSSGIVSFKYQSQLCQRKFNGVHTFEINILANQLPCGIYSLTIFINQKAKIVMLLVEK